MALTKISTAMISQSAAAVDLNVDAGTFYVDTTNNRVGVGGKTDPDTPLHVIGTVTATLFAGSGASLTNIPNAALTNSSITINSTAVSLGGSLTLTTANIAENTNLYYTNARADARIAAADTDDLSEGSSNLYYTDARVDARVSGGSLGNITTTGYIRGPATFTIDPAAHGDNTGTVVIAGNLQVDGTQTVINSTTLAVDDKNITLASGSANAAAASGAGFTVDIGSGTNPAITYDGTNDEWDFNKKLNVTGSVTSTGLTVASTAPKITIEDTDATSTHNKTELENSGGALNLNTRQSNGTYVSTDYQIMKNSSGATLQRWYTQGTEAFRLDSNQNAYLANGSLMVGSTTAPTHKLEVDGTFRTTGTVTHNGANLDLRADNARLLIEEADGTDITWLGDHTGGGHGGLFLYNHGGTATVKLTADSHANYINNGNNFGIGTSSPTHKLHTSTSATGVYIQREISSNAANLSEFNSNRSLIIKNRTGGSFLMFGGNGSRTDIQATDGAGTPTAKNIALNPFGGNVGINDTAPTATLDILNNNVAQVTLNVQPPGSGDAHVAQISRGSGSHKGSGLRIGGANYTNGTNANAAFLELAAGSYSGANTKYIHAYDNSGTDFLVRGDGNVGIGTDSPDAKLSVTSSTINSEDILYLKSGADNVNDYLGIAWELGVGGNGPHSAIRSFAGPSGSDARLGFLTTSNGGTTLTEGLSLAHDGNVGIGTDTPLEKLHVKHGDIRLEGNGESGQDITFTITNDNSGNEVEAGLIRFIDTGGGQSNRGSAIASYMPTADTGDLRFYTSAGSDREERMRIYRDGNVGLGTTSPTAPLSIRKVHATGYGSGIDMLDFKAYYPPNYDTETSKASIFVGTSNKHTLNTHGGYLAFKVNQSGFSGSGSTNLIEAMRIEKDGNVGIGTVAPMSSLHVNKDTAGNNTDGITIGKVEANGWIDSGEEMGRLSWAASYGSSYTQGIGAYISAKADANWNGNEAPTRLGFFTAPENSLTPVERLRIDKDGKVGIGRTDPTQLLEVHKAAGGDQTVAKFSAHNYGDTGKTFIEIGTEYGDGSSRIGSFNDTGNKSVLVFDTHDATSGAFAERMRINSSGNVGIGTNAPGHLLDILKSGSGDATVNIKSTTGGDPTIIFNSAAANRQGIIKFQDNGTNVGRIDYVHNGDRIDIQAGSATGATMSIKNGAVGIGTGAPSTRLEVRNSTTATDTIIASAGLATAGNYHELILGDSRNYAVGLRRSITQSNPGWLRPRLDFIVQDQNTYLPADREVRMSIKDNGNVGIGTTSPGSKLTVKNATATDGNNIADFIGSDTNQRLIVANFLCGSDEDRVGLYWENQGTINMRMWMADTGNLYLNSSNPSNDTDGSRVLLSESNGNTLVGTQIHFNNTTASSFIGAASGVNLRYAADGYHRFDTYNGGWGERVQITDTGCLPGSDSTYNLGSPSLRWANVYTGDLHLSNEEKGGNDVDGTTGNWTIQEGDENLYIKNNKTGKKYKFALEEIV